MAKSSLSAWLPLILADFVGTPIADFEVRLIDFDPARPDGTTALIPDIDTWGIPDKPSARRLLLQVTDDVTKSFENVKSLDWLADDRACLAVEISSTLQDHVMDHLNATWPDVIVDGRTVVLEPRLGPDGTPRWEGRGVEPCPIGQLVERLA